MRAPPRHEGVDPRVTPASPAREPARSEVPASRPPGAAELFGAGDDEFAAAADALGEAAATAALPALAPQEALGVEPRPGDAAPEPEFDIDVDVDDEAPLAPAPPAADAPWPTAVPDAPQAADALARALAGEAAPPGTPVAAATAAVLAMSALERSVLAGEPHPIDTAPIRRAAVMRVRVAAALDAAPPAGSPVDFGAVAAFLRELDALLSDVKTLAEDAPADLQDPIEAVRSALVKEAMDLSRAARRAAVAGA